MFAPINVAGPDQRRKQLMAKLGQQQQGNLAGRASAAQSVGQAFHPAVMHALVKAASTQGTNVLPSVLARLGIMGHQNPDEVSQGLGAPISSYTPGVGVQDPNQGATGIPVAGAADPMQAAAALGGPAAPAGTPPAPFPTYITGDGTGTFTPTNYFQNEQGLKIQKVIPAYAPGAQTSGGLGAVSSHEQTVAADNPMLDNALVSLGGGHFFNPNTGQISFNPNGTNAFG